MITGFWKGESDLAGNSLFKYWADCKSFFSRGVTCPNVLRSMRKMVNANKAIRLTSVRQLSLAVMVATRIPPEFCV